MNDKLLESIIACPVDFKPLVPELGGLVCEAGHHFPLVDGTPVLIPPQGNKGYWGISESDPKAPAPPDSAIDPFVQQVIAATGGYLYKAMRGKLQNYPIPEIPLPKGNGEIFVEVGCNWGRWSLAASKKGYTTVGVEPHLDAVFAAKRVAKQLGIDARFVVGDGRYLPIRTGAIDVVFSYSVLQHFSREDVGLTLDQIKRVLKPKGVSKIQMANGLGARSLYHLMRRKFREPRDFEVRYWNPIALRQYFAERIGPSNLEVDGYFSTNAQASDLPLLPTKEQMFLHLSLLAKHMASFVPGLSFLADSLYVCSQKATQRSA